MGALPKRKISPGRRNRRRAHDSLKPHQLIECDNCGELKRPHYVCPHCGTYKGHDVVEISEA
jgi:large subunit ribosomal protein L32